MTALDAITHLRATLAPERFDKTLKWLEAPGHRVIALADPEYPAMLREISDPPAVLYVTGRVELLNSRCFSIVGSRNASVQGMRDAQSFAHALSDAGLAIASGLALGIDAAAHRGGLRGRGSSIAVVGTGADRIYPPRNRELAHEIAERGVIISEFPLGTSPRPENFPQRNRLISGLSKGVLVVEAALESGSLITARFANEQGRDVFAIPGSIHSPMSKGCHKLIKDGAKLVDGVGDIFEELGLDEVSAPSARPFAQSDDGILDAMGGSPVSIDQLAERTGESAKAVATRMSLLQIEGRIAAMSGGLFQRLQESIE
jgi:DNA processing protein